MHGLNQHLHHEITVFLTMIHSQVITCCFPCYNSLLLLLASGWRLPISESSCWCVQQLVSVFKEHHSERTARGPLTQWSSRTRGACHCLPHARLSEDKHTRLQIETARNRCSHSPLKSLKHTNKLPVLLNRLPAAFCKKGFCFNQPPLWSKIMSRCFQSTLRDIHTVTTRARNCTIIHVPDECWLGQSVPILIYWLRE